jgi:hypothetical protein
MPFFEHHHLLSIKRQPRFPLQVLRNRCRGLQPPPTFTPGFPLQSGVGIQPNCSQQHLQCETVNATVNILQHSAVILPRKTIVYVFIRQGGRMPSDGYRMMHHITSGPHNYLSSLSFSFG